jgi:ADP-heptose:LPS heptosyltransferase
MKKILVLRFSAMGDVALTVPVIRSLVAAHKDVEVTIVTRPRFAAFFAGIERVIVFDADVDHKFKGFFGIRQLFRALVLKKNFDVVIDLHDHVRTIILRNLFKLFGKHVVVFDKGRKEKKAFTRQENKITKPLPHTVERYHRAFEKAGFQFKLLQPPYLIPTEESKKLIEAWFTKKGLVKGEKWIGIAPFAMHKSKIWPVANYPKLIDTILKKMPARFFLFGGGDEEIQYFEDLQTLFPQQCVIVAGRLKLPQELTLMHHLDLMVCVDSSNMHLAALSNTPVLSIWGGTHPDVGFAPFGQNNEASILQISRDELPCRPCSVYGKETSLRGDFACLNWLTPEIVAGRVFRRLQN